MENYSGDISTGMLNPYGNKDVETMFLTKSFKALNSVKIVHSSYNRR